jgi:hypothetical protein
MFLYGDSFDIKRVIVNENNKEMIKKQNMV